MLLRASANLFKLQINKLSCKRKTAEKFKNEDLHTALFSFILTNNFNSIR